jgi:sulfite reductase (NADPH) hemoprotein beta-component
MVGKTIRDFLPADELLPYVTAIMRVYNRFGPAGQQVQGQDQDPGARDRRGRDERAGRGRVRARRPRGRHQLAAEEVARIRAYFAPPPYEELEEKDAAHHARLFEDKAFARWVRQKHGAPQVKGYIIANISLKPIGASRAMRRPEQMRVVADLADAYSFGEIRVAHEQNLVLPTWRCATCMPLAGPGCRRARHAQPQPRLRHHRLPRHGLLLARDGRSIPVAQAISRRFAELAPRRTWAISGSTSRAASMPAATTRGASGHSRAREEGGRILPGHARGSGDENARSASSWAPASPRRDRRRGRAVVRVYLDGRTGTEERFLAFFRRVGISTSSRRSMPCLRT